MTEKLRLFLGIQLAGVIDDGERLLNSAGGGFNDYSFAVFPFAKVYEGFLKKLFFEIGAIDEHQFHSDHWRVGKALNPQLEKDLRHAESVYDRLVDFIDKKYDSHTGELTKGKIIADRLWQTWKTGRNQVFHFFPNDFKFLDFPSARQLCTEIINTMEDTLVVCTN